MRRFSEFYDERLIPEQISAVRARFHYDEDDLYNAWMQVLLNNSLDYDKAKDIARKYAQDNMVPQW